VRADEAVGAVVSAFGARFGLEMMEGEVRATAAGAAS
jgi:hypothetical protein